MELPAQHEGQQLPVVARLVRQLVGYLGEVGLGNPVEHARRDGFEREEAGRAVGKASNRRKALVFQKKLRPSVVALVFELRPHAAFLDLKGPVGHVALAQQHRFGRHFEAVKISEVALLGFLAKPMVGAPEVVEHGRAK